MLPGQMLPGQMLPVTVTVVICSIWSQQCFGTIGSVTAEIVGALCFCGGWWLGGGVGFALQFSRNLLVRLTWTVLSDYTGDWQSISITSIILEKLLLLNKTFLWTLREVMRMCCEKFGRCLEILKCKGTFLMCLGSREAELKKNFFHLVSIFPAEKYPKYGFSEFCHKMTHDIEQMPFFFLSLLIWGWTVS